MPPPKLTLAELYDVQKKKQHSRNLSFDRVLELCHRRIRTVASYGGMNTFFEIPGMIIGFPLYNVIECCNYMVDALRKNGFLIQILPPPHIAVIYISWDPNDVRPPVKKNTPALLEASNQNNNGKGSKKSNGMLRLF